MTSLTSNQEWYLNTTTLRGDKRQQAVDVMTTIRTVGQLTEEHRGWQVNVPAERSIKGYRQIDFDGIRRWDYKGIERVGLLAKEYDKPYRHTEYHFTADTPCELLWQSRKPKARKR